MKFIKTLAIIVVSIIALVFIVALFLPAEVHVERSMVMKSSPENVYTQVSILKNWEGWSPWHKIDPKMQLTYEGPASGVGAKYIWKSTNKNVGSGSLAITEVKQNELVSNVMEFDGMGQSNSAFKLEKVPEGTKVTWTMDSKGEGCPWYMKLISRYFHPWMDAMVGPDFEKGLNNMKTIVESMPAGGSSMKMEEVSTTDMMVLTTHINCTKAEIPKYFGEAMGKLVTYLGMHKAKMAGPAFAVIMPSEKNMILMQEFLWIKK